MTQTNSPSGRTAKLKDDARGPIRVFLFDYDVQDEAGDWKTQRGWSETPPYPMLSTEYRRADLSPQPVGAVKVRALEWKNGHAHGIGHHYFTRNGCLYRNETSGETGLHFGPAWEIEKVAQADYEARIRSALEPAPQPDPMADPRVWALVEAASDMASIAHQEGWHNAMTGREMILRDLSAALAAFDTTGCKDD